MSIDAPSRILVAQSGEVKTRHSLGGYLVMPAVLAAVCLALYVYVATKELDSIEARAMSVGRLSTEIWTIVTLTAVSQVLTLVLDVPSGGVTARPIARRMLP